MLAIDHETVVEQDEIARLTAAVDRGLTGLTQKGLPAPEDWRERLPALFARHFASPFAERHEQLWEWVSDIELDSDPPAFVAVWPRGGGKTTNAEGLVTDLGCRGKRRYAWYVSETQDKADNNIRNIAALLESSAVERHYPAHAERMLTKYGHSKGWTSQRLRTRGGLTVDAIGLDTAQRGLKVEDQRPDLIILDDIDGRHDTLQTTAKKIITITDSILPAGSTHCAVLAIQNLIIANGFFTRLVDGRADYLTNRIVSGPHPAIEGLETKWVHEHDNIRRAEITAGTATWEGQSLDDCQRMIERFGLHAFLRECQHKVKELAEGAVIRFDSSKHMQSWSDADIIEGVGSGRLVPFSGIDYGHWRFAFLLGVVDRAGRVHIIHEYFDQRNDLTHRAQAIDAILLRYGIEDLKVYGDPANPTDARELNAALERGWSKDGKDRKPRWRATAAIKDRGSRRTGPDRINDMLSRRALMVRRDIGRRQEWNLGMSASSSGEPQIGSRFLWELGEWSYPDPREGEAQGADPDDNTADGADMMAAWRYMIMSWLKAATFEKPKPKRNSNIDQGLERIAKRARELAKAEAVA